MKTFLLFVIALFTTISTFAQAPTNGLVAYYPFNGNANDVSGTGNNGTINTTTTTMDRFGNASGAASFGNGKYVKVPSSTSLQFTNKFSYSVWIKLNSTFGCDGYGSPSSNGFHPIFTKDCDNFCLYAGFAKNANGTFGYSTGTWYGGNNSEICYALNNWVNLTSVYDGTSMKLFVNGVLISDKSTSINFAFSNYRDLYIGKMYCYCYYFNGDMDDFRIYNRALTNSEVAILAQGSVTPPCSGSFVQLTSPIRFGGGLSTLNVGTGYNFTASLKNNGSASWVGDVYLKVKGGTPTLVSSNNVISAGGIYNISSTFNPITSQIGQNVSVELLTKQGTNDFTRASVVNGTVNPIVVNIEAASSVPVVRVPFIRLNQSEVNLGGTVQIIGGNFEPNTQVTIGSSPDILGAVYQAVTVAADGSINATFTVPTTFKERYLTIIGRNVKSDNPGALVLVNQPQEVATLSITKPYKANETINITPEGNVAIEFSDKLLKGSVYPQSGASRSYRYEIGYQYAGGTVYFPLKQLPVETDLLNKEIRKTVLVPMTGFSTISQSGGWLLKFIIKDLYNNQRVAESPLVNINVVQNISKISMKWDRSFSPMPSQDPIGISADGVARMYLVLEKNSPTGSPIQSVSVTLANYESNNNPTNFNNGAWLGRVKYANSQNNTQYSEEANGITTITAQNLSTNTDGKYWFWYVAPDDFTKDGAGYTDDSERSVYAKFTVTYADGTVELVTQDIQIVRPPLMLVHGLGGSAKSTWNEFPLVNGVNRNLFKGNIYPVDMYPTADFKTNALVLAGKNVEKYQSSIPFVLSEMRNKGFATNQVDYVCHSMGGAMLRSFVDNFSKFYFVNSVNEANSPSKNYQKGWVNKFITLNTPHNGTPWADLITNIVPLLPKSANRALTELNLWSYKSTNSIFSLPNTFIKPTDASLNSFWGPYRFEATNAVKNLQIIAANEGVDFKALNGIPSHLIAGDIIKGSQAILNMEGTLLDIEQYNRLLKIFYYVCEYIADNKRTGNEPQWLNDFMDHMQDNYPQLFDSATSEVEKAKIVVKVSEVFCLFAFRYNNIFVDGDVIVPLVSQTAGIPLNAPYVSVLNDAIIFDKDKLHTKITGDITASNKVKLLLNQSIGSQYFTNSIPTNVRPTTSTFTNGKNNNTKNISSAIRRPFIEKFDISKIQIVSPVSNSSAEIGNIIQIKVNVKDTLFLKNTEIIFQGDKMTDTSKRKNITFVKAVDKSFMGNYQIMAVAKYIKNDTVFFKYDTLSIKINSNENIQKITVSPESVSLSIDEKMRPSYDVVYSSFNSNYIDLSKLNISISNTSCLSYNTQTGQFKGLQKGEAVVIFTYDGIFKDTMYVAVGGGGVPYTQQISTSNVPVTGNGTICTGATVSVPFTISGGVFDVGNQYIVQLSDASGENFVSLETTGITSPLSARIPNGLSNADTYKIRVVSTSPPVIGTVAVQPIKIRNQDTVPIVSVKTGNWNDASTWSCGRIPIITNNITIAGGHTVTIPNGQTGFANNLTQIGTLINTGNLRLKAEL